MKLQPINHLLSIASLKHEYYALRHGRSLANELGIISSDPEISTRQHGLTDVGREQVKSSAASFLQLCRSQLSEDGSYSGGVAIVTSDFLRARETAEIFHQSLAVGLIPMVFLSSDNSGSNITTAGCDESPRIDVRLRERYFGQWNGGPDSGYQEVWAGDAIDADQITGCVESVNDVMRRTTKLILDLEDELSQIQERSGRGTDDSIDDSGMPACMPSLKCILVAHGDVLQILQTAFQKKDGSVHRSLEHLETATVRKLELTQDGGT